MCVTSYKTNANKKTGGVTYTAVVRERLVRDVASRAATEVVNEALVVEVVEASTVVVDELAAVAL